MVKKAKTILGVQKLRIHSSALKCKRERGGRRTQGSNKRDRKGRRTNNL